MRKRSAETDSKDSKMARRDFITTTAAVGAGLLIVTPAIAFSTANLSPGPDISKKCDVGQGFVFKQDQRQTFGYINSFSFGDDNIAQDIKVTEPVSVVTDTASGTPATGGSAPTGPSGIYTKAVVGVLSQVTWSTLPNDSIILQARISVQNAQLLNALIMKAATRIPVTVSFVVYDYDLVKQQYFTSVRSYMGSAPKVGAPTGGGGSASSKDPSAPPINALISKRSGAALGIKISPNAQTDPVGIKNHILDLTLAPPIAPSPQQIMIQTSANIKMIQPWGIPQN